MVHCIAGELAGHECFFTTYYARVWPRARRQSLPPQPPRNLNAFREGSRI